MVEPYIFANVPVTVPRSSFGDHESIGYSQLGGESLPLRHLCKSVDILDPELEMITFLILFNVKFPHGITSAFPTLIIVWSRFV